MLYLFHISQFDYRPRVCHVLEKVYSFSNQSNHFNDSYKIPSTLKILNFQKNLPPNKKKLKIFFLIFFYGGEHLLFGIIIFYL